MIKHGKEWVWGQFEKKAPTIKDMFEVSVVTLRLSNYNEAFTTANFGYNSIKEPLLRCHLYSDLCFKIFSLYYNTNTNEMFIRNQLNAKGTLMTSSIKTKIKSMEQLQVLLNEVVINRKEK